MAMRGGSGFEGFTEFRAGFEVRLVPEFRRTPNGEHRTLEP
jgi:hypothetical protein